MINEMYNQLVDTVVVVRDASRLRPLYGGYSRPLLGPRAAKIVAIDDSAHNLSRLRLGSPLKKGRLRLIVTLQQKSGKGYNLTRYSCCLEDLTGFPVDFYKELLKEFA